MDNKKELNNDDFYDRLSVRVPKDIKNWYREEGKLLGLTMTQYAAFVLVNHQRNTDNAKAIKQLSEITTGMNIKETKETNKEMMDFIKSNEFKLLIEEVKKPKE